MYGKLRSKWRRIFSVSFGISVSIACLFWLVSSVDMVQLKTALENANYFYVFIAFIMTISSYMLRAWRWEFFFRSREVAPSYFNLVRCLFVGFFMNNILPARAGELVRAHVGRRYSGEGRTEVLATIASERLADGLVLSLIFAVLFSMDPATHGSSESRELFWVAYFFLGVAISVFTVLACRELFFKIIDKVSSIFPGSVSEYSVERIRRFVTGLEPLFHFQKLRIVVPQSLFIWMWELAVYYIISIAFHYELSYGCLALFLAAVNFSSLIPAAPGGVGVIETFTTIALVTVGIDKEVAVAMVVTQHLIQMLAVGIPGSIFLFGTMGGRISDKHESAHKVADEATRDVAQLV